jgi:hypothetical protein
MLLPVCFRTCMCVVQQLTVYYVGGSVRGTRASGVALDRADLTCCVDFWNRDARPFSEAEMVQKWFRYFVHGNWWERTVHVSGTLHLPRKAGERICCLLTHVYE